MEIMIGGLIVGVGILALIDERIARFVIMDNRVTGPLLRMFTDGSVSEETFMWLRSVCATLLILSGLATMFVIR